ncbi:hypothetical protein O1D97_11260 [Marinomonas sp. 15G1-11]|uniref:Exonuclease SbcC n=1 Tax=Marinomonas phaeophyticola TaxID=3004091 RepID=A0ABT4JUY2_9GAMM|nr:hypothetical protein [Marinomonas sp. 15G1-11]MCZ2722199.1 hypothetical protein [Marinomonas sp. 15G1-11]
MQDFVLAEAPLQVGAYQKSLLEYRQLESKTQEVAKRIDDLNLIVIDCEKKRQQEQNVINYQWIATEARFDELGAKQDEIQDQFEMQQEREDEIQQELQTQNELYKQLQSQLLRLEQQFENSDIGFKLQQLEQSKSLLTRQIQQEGKSLQQTKQLMELLSTLPSFEDLLSTQLNNIANKCLPYRNVLQSDFSVEGSLTAFESLLLNLNTALDEEKVDSFKDAQKSIVLFLI